MTCGKVYDKLWNNYLTKYGDIRERLHANHLSEIVINQTKIDGPDHKRYNKYNRSVAPEICHSSIKNNRQSVTNQIDPNVDTLDDNHQQLQSEISKHDLNFYNHKLQMKQDKTYQTTSKSNISTSNITRNPYAQYLRQMEKMPHIDFDPKLSRKASDIKPSSIEKFLSFLRSLETSTTTTTEDTLLNIFSVDNYLSSSTYIPINIHPLNRIPKPILHSLNSNSHDENILHEIQEEISSNKDKELNSKLYKNSKTFLNINKPIIHSNEDSHSSDSIQHNNKLNSKLSNSYAAKAFKEFLIHDKKSLRLPKLFQDIDQLDQK